MKKGNKTNNTSKKEVKKNIPNLLDSKKNNYVMDSANVMCLAKTPDFIDVDGFECKEFGKMFLIKWDSLQTNMDKDIIFLKGTKISYDCVDRFVKTMRAFCNNKSLRYKDIGLYESERADLPVVLVYRDIMAVLAPRVQ